MTPFPPGRRAELPGAVVTEEVVAREDVVDLQALRAGEALADVALQEALVVHYARALAIAQEGVAGGPMAGLAEAGRLHPRSSPGMSKAGECTMSRDGYNDCPFELLRKKDWLE
jgi:hypothetical protein